MSTYPFVDDCFDSDPYPAMLHGALQEPPMRVQLMQDWNTLSEMAVATIRITVLRVLFWFLRRTYPD